MTAPLKTQFTEWLRSQDPNTEYDYHDLDCCPIAQFLDDIGVFWRSNRRATTVRCRLENELRPWLFAEPWAMGALAERLPK